MNKNSNIQRNKICRSFNKKMKMTKKKKSLPFSPFS